MYKLEQEQFKAVEELAELQTNISLGRANLVNIKETTEQYMKLREKQAQERVIKVLKESRDALEKTSTYQEELRAYNRELQAFATELGGFAIDITTLFEDFNKRMASAELTLDTNYKKVQGVLEQIKKEREGVADDRERLGLEWSRIKKEKRKLNDRHAFLEKEINRLNEKKI